MTARARGAMWHCVSFPPQCLSPLALRSARAIRSHSREARSPTSMAKDKAVRAYQKAPVSKNAYKQLISNYSADTPPRFKLIDAFLAFLFVTGILQFVYCIVLSNYPFNSFLSGFAATVGQFVLSLALRLQLGAGESGKPRVAEGRYVVDLRVCMRIGSRILASKHVILTHEKSVCRVPFRICSLTLFRCQLPWLDVQNKNTHALLISSTLAR